MSSTKTFTCQWLSCQNKTVFPCIEDLVDHVNKDHLLEPTENEDGDMEVQCQWSSCRTAKSHGDTDKMITWIKEHFLIKHAKSAKMFKCPHEGCDVRKSSEKQLKGHLNNNHLPIKEKPEPKPKAEKPARKIREPKPEKEDTDIESALEEDEVWTDPEYEYQREMDVNPRRGYWSAIFYSCHNLKGLHYIKIQLKAMRIPKKKGQKLTLAQKKTKRAHVEEKMAKQLYRKLKRKIKDAEKKEHLLPCFADPLVVNERDWFEKYEEKLEKERAKKEKQQNRKRPAVRSEKAPAKRAKC